MPVLIVTASAVVEVAQIPEFNGLELVVVPDEAFDDAMAVMGKTWDMTSGTPVKIETLPKCEITYFRIGVRKDAKMKTLEETEEVIFDLGSFVSPYMPGGKDMTWQLGVGNASYPARRLGGEFQALFAILGTSIIRYPRFMANGGYTVPLPILEAGLRVNQCSDPVT